MNQVKTGCSNCYYYHNSYCTYGNSCSGVTCMKPDANGHLVTLPVDAPVVSDIEPQLTTHCLICDKEILIYKFEKGPKICDECKKAIGWAKGRLKAENESSLEYRQKKDPNGFRITVKEFVQRFAPHGSKVLLVESTIRAQGNNTNTFKIHHKALWEGFDCSITDPIETCPEDSVCNLRDWLVEGVVVNAEYLSLSGKITLSIRRDNEKTSEEKILDEVRLWSTQTNSEMNGTKDTIIATNSKEEAMESKPEEIKPNYFYSYNRRGHK